MREKAHGRDNGLLLLLLLVYGFRLTSMYYALYDVKYWILYRPGIQ